MKKVLALLLTMVLTLGLGLTALAESAYELAMITDEGNINDKSFNQSTWESIEAYAKTNGKTYQYYRPVEMSTDAYLDEIDKAVSAGAKVVVTPGYLFEVPIFIAQDKYPDVHFVLIDGYPNNGIFEPIEQLEERVNDNVVGIKFAEEQAGFLAGYAVVKEGYTKLGFMGGRPYAAVVRFGYGFVQGAEAAAKELGIPEITLSYHYAGEFLPSPEIQTKAATWYNSGIEAIFACAGGAGNSVMAAASATEKGVVVGVDKDQSSESDRVITSAMKDLNAAVSLALDAYYSGDFPSGEKWTLAADKNGVGLPMATSRFTKFTQEDYDALYAKLQSGEIKVIKDTDEQNNPLDVTDLGTTITKITVIE